MEYYSIIKNKVRLPYQNFMVKKRNTSSWFDTKIGVENQPKDDALSNSKKSIKKRPVTQVVN